jgi:hypothetical protein
MGRDDSRKIISRCGAKFGASNPDSCCNIALLLKYRDYTNNSQLVQSPGFINGSDPLMIAEVPLRIIFHCLVSPICYTRVERSLANIPCKLHCEAGRRA